VAIPQRYTHASTQDGAKAELMTNRNKQITENPHSFLSLRLFSFTTIRNIWDRVSSVYKKLTSNSVQIQIIQFRLSRLRGYV